MTRCAPFTPPPASPAAASPAPAKPARWIDRRLQACALRNGARIRGFVSGTRILELGSAESWIGGMLKAEAPERDVQLVDVVDMNRTDLPLTVYDGYTIPFPDDHFDTTLVMMVLHHCDDPEQVLREAARVTRGRLIVTESVYRIRPGCWMLWAIDNLVNGLRSGGLMAEGLHFRTAARWRETFARHGLRLCGERWMSRGLHRHIAFVLDPGPTASGSLPRMHESLEAAAE